jgi:hypothetical protein
MGKKYFKISAYKRKRKVKSRTPWLAGAWTTFFESLYKTKFFFGLKGKGYLIQTGVYRVSVFLDTLHPAKLKPKPTTTDFYILH